MKNQILTTAIIILNAFWLQANSTANVSNNLGPCEGDFVLNSQAEVDAFAALACTEISGSLIIETTDSNDPIVDLSGLINLTNVSNGGLSIINNSELTTLNGLSIKNRLSDFRSLIIENNESLVDINAIQTITVAFSLVIKDNPNLHNCCPAKDIGFPDFSPFPQTIISGNGSGCFIPARRCSRSELFTNVDAIGLNSSTNPSPVIACNNSNTFTLFSANNSLAECPLPMGVAGFTNGGGLFAAFGSSGWLQNDQVINYDNLQFFSNCMNWLAIPECDGIGGFTTIISKDFPEIIDMTYPSNFGLHDNFVSAVSGCRGFTIKGSEQFPNNFSPIPSTAILIIDDIWDDFTLEQLNIIENFIDRGGNLLLFGSGADYVANVGNNITNYPMNPIGQMLGITWTDGLVTPDEPIVFTDFDSDDPTCTQSEINVSGLCGDGDSSVPLCESLTACYGFDGSYVDLSSNENDGAINISSGSIPFTTDRYGVDNKALEFTEFLQLIELPNNILNCVYCTQSFWIKTTAENGTIISAKKEDFKNLYKIRLEDGKLGVNLNSTEDAVNFAYADKLINDGDWHHIVIVIDKVDNTDNPFPEGSKEINIYVDEVKQNILPSSTVVVGIDQFIIPENEIYLGNAHRISDGIVTDEDQFIGSIDDLQFYDKALTFIEIKRIEHCAPTIPLVPGRSGSISQYNWSMNYETSEDDGMVLTDITLGTRKMVERLSIPYIRFSTALNDDEIIRLELKNSCATEPYSSRLADFDILASNGKLSLISTYEIKNIKGNPDGVLKVTQRYEFEDLPEDENCEPEDLKYGLTPIINHFSPKEAPCNYFRFTVEYEFSDDTVGDIFVDIPQRIHTKIDDITRNHVRFFKDLDLNVLGLPECRGGLATSLIFSNFCLLPQLLPEAKPEGISPIDESFYVKKEEIVKGISGGKKADMDNFHLSADEEILGPTAANPGCPQCFHVHWRWTDLIKDEGFGGGDPIIPEGSNQDLDIGIVNYEENEIDPNSKWEDLINSTTDDPEPIDAGGFVMWYGSKGYQKSDKFFTHEGFFYTEFIDLGVEIKLNEEEDAIPLGEEFTFEVEVYNVGFANIPEIKLELTLFPFNSNVLEIINLGDCEYNGSELVICKSDLGAGEKVIFPLTIKINSIDGFPDPENFFIDAFVSSDSNLFDGKKLEKEDQKEIKILQPIDLNIDCFVQNNDNELEIDEEGIIEFVLSNNPTYSDFIDILSPIFEVCLPDEIRPIGVSSESSTCFIDFDNEAGPKIICNYPDNPGKRGKSNENYKKLVEFDRVTVTIEGAYPREAEVIATLKSLSPEAFPADNSDTLILNVLPGDSLFNWYQDLDEDNLGNQLVDSLSTTPPAGYVYNNNDTDDNCNGIHDECGICNGNGKGTWFRDLDGDGFGNLEIAIEACTKPNGFVSNHNDYNDEEECIGELDECNVCNGTGQISRYQDLDGDGLGNINITISACRKPNGYVANTNDDNDNEECKGELDECGICNGNGVLMWFQDLDGDGLGSNLAILNCTQPDGFVYNNYDDSDICPGSYDECGVCNGTGPITWYQDLDGDGEGNPSINFISCLPRNGFVSNDTDENDNEPCNGEVDVCGICNGYGGDLYFEDADGDGLGNRTSWLLACDKPEGYVNNIMDVDDTTVGVSVNQIQATKDFSIEAIIPMPVYQYFDLVINSKKVEVVSIEIYNSAGQMLYQQNNQLKSQHNKLRIDANDLPSGIHLLSVKSSKSIVTDKIIKY